MSKVICVQCHLPFIREDNLGSHKCRMHTGTVMYGTDLHITKFCYTCCNRPSEDNYSTELHGDNHPIDLGCTKCDHREEVGDSMAPYIFSFYASAHKANLKDLVQRPGVSINVQTGKVTVLKVAPAPSPEYML